MWDGQDATREQKPWRNPVQNVREGFCEEVTLSWAEIKEQSGYKEEVEGIRGEGQKVERSMAPWGPEIRL